MTTEHSPKNMGRQKNCLADYLQTQTFMHSLCDELGVRHTGGQLEKIFEGKSEIYRYDGTKQRNGKFRRQLRGKNTASPRTIEIILKNPDTTISKTLLESSFWQAIQQGKSTPNWLSFFKTLRPSLQDIALKTDSDNQQKIKKVNRYTGGRLLKEGDIEALACAIAIHRAIPFTIWQHKLSSAITKLMGWVFAKPAFVESKRKLCDLICNEFRATDFDVEVFDENFCKPYDNIPCYTIYDLINKNIEFISRAREIGLIRHNKDFKNMFVLSDKGDKQRIFEEMKLVLTLDYYELTDKGKGLYWFVTELNKHHRQDLDIFNATGTYSQSLGLHRIITPKTF